LLAHKAYHCGFIACSLRFPQAFEFIGVAFLVLVLILLFEGFLDGKLTHRETSLAFGQTLKVFFIFIIVFEFFWDFLGIVLLSRGVAQATESTNRLSTRCNEIIKLDCRFNIC
jgi:hypothetical protein